MPRISSVKQKRKTKEKEKEKEKQRRHVRPSLASSPAVKIEKETRKTGRANEQENNKTKYQKKRKTSEKPSETKDDRSVGRANRNAMASLAEREFFSLPVCDSYRSVFLANPTGFIGFRPLIQGSTGFLLSFARLSGFYWVLPGFTEFYRVLLGF